jgi:hypothetical protein
MSEVDELKDLTDQQLFDKMISHHVMSSDKSRTDRSRWHHEKLYKHTKRLLWERSDSNADRKSD